MSIINKFEQYHSDFQGDTYDACSRCGGKCEKHKISTLMPGEKDYMAGLLGISEADLDEKYLSRINLPNGTVEILKMSDGCPFLDDEYRCAAVAAKPVLCDTYPIVFYKSKGAIRFKIDQNDCPMVHWPEYKHVIKDFRKNGIDAITKISVDPKWWDLVLVYDEYDYDYQRLEKELGSRNNGFYYIEEILGYACNGYEVKARKKGMELLKQRFKTEVDQLEKRFPLDKKYSGKVTLQLANSYRYYFKAKKNSFLNFLHASKKNDSLLSNPDGAIYLDAVYECLNAIKQLGDDLERLVARLNETKRIVVPANMNSKAQTQPLDHIEDKFKSGNFKDSGEFAIYELINEHGHEFWEVYNLLVRDFGTDIIDDPISVRDLMKQCRLGKGIILKIDSQGKKRKIWVWWITALIKDKNNRIIGAGDGTIISDGQMSIFYASHIVVRPEFRSYSLGTYLSAGILQIAENKLREFLPDDFAGKGVNSRQLLSEVGEIEFPENMLVDPDSNKRLLFHGRLNRRVLWPVLYAQPDTDYHLADFIQEKWNSVPMFICYRSFSPDYQSIDDALKAVNLLYDFFAATSENRSEYDRNYLNSHLSGDPKSELLPLPTKYEELSEFINLNGTRKQLLKKYYSDHFYTKEKVENDCQSQPI